jgi:hypothetical protein
MAEWTAIPFPVEMIPMSPEPFGRYNRNKKESKEKQRKKIGKINGTLLFLET